MNSSFLLRVITLAALSFCSGCALSKADEPATTTTRAPASQSTRVPTEIKALRTLYVSLSGSDDNDGLSPQRALRSPRHAASLTLPGDAVLFAAGTYEIADGETMTIRRSGEPGKPIVYAPMPGAQVTFYNRLAWEAISIKGARHIEIRGLRIRGHSDDVKLEEAMAEMSNRGNARTSDNGIGITWDDATKAPAAFITVRDCEILGCGGGGVYSSHSDHITFENNVVHGCAFWSPYANSAISIYQPIDVDNSTDYKMIIRNNVAYGNYEYVPFFHSDADPAKRRVSDGNGIILDDYLNSQSWGGGSKPYQGRTLVANNIVFDNGGSGIHAYAGTNVDIVFNMAFGNNLHPQIKSGQIYALSAKNVRILNNVMIAPPGVPVNLDRKNEGVIYDFNLYATTDGSTPQFAGAKASNRLAASGVVLKGWPEGKRLIEVAPATPLRAAGTPFPAVATDFFGQPRDPKTPDIGPFTLKNLEQKVAKKP